MRVLLWTPPLTQLNTPYPASSYLAGFLKKNNVSYSQTDFSIEWVHRIFNSKFLSKILPLYADHFSEIDSVLSFLKGKNPTLANQIVNFNLLPLTPRLLQANEDSMQQENQTWAFGTMGIQDKAKYLCSLYIDDIAELIQNEIDPFFSLSRYGDKLAASQSDFGVLLAQLAKPPTALEKLLEELVEEQLLQLVERTKIKEISPLICLTAPFPGNVYGALRIAKTVKSFALKNKINLPIAFGGGYANTELRELNDIRVFDYFDFICLDDGEKPLLCLIEHLKGTRKSNELVRTFYRDEKKIIYSNNTQEKDIPQNETGYPTYEGLDLDKYFPLLEMLNPMHRIWSDGRWNKLTLAHGCYWKKCTFCDTSLDYISRYEAASAKLTVARMKNLIAETQQTGFHFVDEAAPPTVLKALSLELSQEKLKTTWWGNIRFEKTFTKPLTDLMAKSGCIAVTGGLEVALERILKLINKGVTLKQVAQVTRSFSDSGIMVHAYLMYGFPSETIQETVDSLEVVRQLFLNGCIQSGFWHRFSTTVHSPVGKKPETFGIKVFPPKSKALFATNDLPFKDMRTDISKKDFEVITQALNKALYNYMHGVGLEEDVRSWFGKKIKSLPKTTHGKKLVSSFLN